MMADVLQACALFQKKKKKREKATILLTTRNLDSISVLGVLPNVCLKL